jgi:quercetin dioxygenase-like cupin family protein
MTATVTGVVRKAGEGTTRRLGRDHVTELVSSVESGGELTVNEAVIGPRWGPPLHRHAWSEYWYVLDGQLTFQIASNEELRTVVVGDGGSFYAPPGVAHTFINHGDAPVRALVIDHPRGMEPFFHAAGAIVDRVDVEAVREAMLGEREVAELLHAGVELVELSETTKTGGNR